jgi:hypothetical protein
VLQVIVADFACCGVPLSTTTTDATLLLPEGGLVRPLTVNVPPDAPTLAGATIPEVELTP